VDFGRIEDMLARIAGIDHRRLSRVSPLAAPLFLEPGKVPIVGEGRERLMAAETERLMAEAGLSAL
jgi:ATP-dependent Lhr-like helicase